MRWCDDVHVLQLVPLSSFHSYNYGVYLSMLQDIARSVPSMVCTEAEYNR